MKSQALAACVALIAALAPSAVCAQPQVPAPSDERILEALARYRSEPSAARVVRAAIATRAADPARARDAIDRARLAGLLPMARAGLRRGQAVDLSALSGGSGDRTNVSTDDDLTFEAALVFRLDRLIFAPEEPSLLRELRALEHARAELVGLVVALYFERRRLQLERDLLSLRDLPRALRILEIEALLDVFTGGAFTRMMGAREREIDEP